MNRNTLRHLPGALLALVMAGCVQAPPPASLTESWVPPEDSKKPDTVWQDLRAQQPDLTKPLSLPAIADLALQNNPATRRAWQDARAASEQIRYAEGYFMPSVTAVASATRVVTAATPESFDQNNMSYGPGLQLNYLICNFGGGRVAAVEQALQTVYAANFAFNRAIHDTLLNAELAYYSVISAQAGVEAATTNALDAKAILDAATARRDAGLGVDLDVLQAKTSHDQSLYTLAGAQGQLQIARGLLAQATGLPADNPISLIPPDAPLPASLTGANVRQLIDNALARRPDLSALRSSLSAREAAIRVARATRWPSLYGTATASRDYYELYGLNNRASQTIDWAYTGGLSLRWNIFDGLQTMSTVHTAEAAAASLRAQLQQAELAASTEIWTRYQNYETALRKHQFSTMAEKSAYSAWDMAMESYKTGVKSILDVLNAETQLSEARSQQIRARQEVFTSLANLAYATGVIEKGGSTLNNITESKDSRENQ